MNIEQMPYLVKPWDHQRRAIAAAVAQRDYAFLMDMGCLSGDAVVRVSRGGGSRLYTMHNLFRLFNGVELNSRERGFANGLKTRVRAWLGENLGLHDIKAVVCSGKRFVHRLVLADGRSIKLTASHEVLTERGWVEAKDLRLHIDAVAIDTLVKHQQTIHVHHLDHNHRNNHPDNLAVLSVKEHAQLHSDGYKNFKHGLVSYSKAVAFAPVGIENTYDIVCNDPHRNFVANEIVVHNSGKTGAAINVLRFHYTNHGRILRTLILCPIVVVPNWKREFKAHSKVDQKAIILLTGSAKDRCKALDALGNNGGVVITNYECLQMKDVVQRLLRWQPEVCISDESQRIKNPKAVRTKVATTIADGARHRYILTGTAILNSAMDIYAQFRFLDGGETFGDNFFQFRGRYFVDRNAGMPAQRYFPDWRPRAGAFDEFNRLIYRKAMRVLKKDCLDLPPFVRQRLEVDMTAQQRLNYLQMEKQLVAYLNSQACVAQLAITKSLRLAQICSGFFRPEETEDAVSYGKTPRLQALEELLEDLTPTHKVIVWACFHENYAAIEALMREMGITGFVRLVGGMTDKARQQAIDGFQNDPKVRVMIANQSAGGVGVNLTAASYAIYYSRNFSLEADSQSEARNYRGGSEIHESITRIDLVCPGTIDEKILDALARKESIANDILNLRRIIEL